MRPTEPRRERTRGGARGGRAWLATGAYLTALASLLVIVRASRGASATEPPVEQLTVAVTAYVGNCALAAAHANGYFTDARLAVTLRTAPTGRGALADALARRADVATVADVPIMLAALAGEPVTVLATFATGTRDHGVVARRDRGVAKTARLRGMRIGVPVGTSAHFYLEALLNRQRLAPAEVRLRDLPPERLSGALASGEVDAVAAWQPFVAGVADALDSNAVVFEGEGVYDVMYNLAAAKALVATRRAALERFLGAVIRGSAFCEEQPHAAQQVVARTFGLDATLVRALWPTYRFRVGLHQALLLALEDETRWAVRNRLRPAGAGYNFLDHLDPGPLRAAAPASVTLLP